MCICIEKVSFATYILRFFVVFMQATIQYFKMCPSDESTQGTMGNSSDRPPCVCESWQKAFSVNIEFCLLGMQVSILLVRFMLHGAVYRIYKYLGSQ